MPATEEAPDDQTYEGSYGGVPLLLVTPELEAFIYQHFQLQRFFVQPYRPAGGWMASADDQWPPIPELNTLYWPTGCTRWGFGVFLVSGELLSKIETAVTADGSALFKWGDPNDPDHYVEAQMRPLCPVPVTGNSGTSNDSDGYPLYLLPLVDVRYGCQMVADVDTGQGYIPGQVFPMSTVLQGANGATGITVTADLDALPDYAENAESTCFGQVLPFNYHTSMQSAEAAAWSLGLTFILELDGTACFMHRDAEVGVDTNASRRNQLIGKVADYTFPIVAGYVAGAEDQAQLDRLFAPSIPFAILFSTTSEAAFEVDRYFVSTGKTFFVNSSDVLGYEGTSRNWRVALPILRNDEGDDDETIQALCFDIANEWLNQIANPIDVTFAGVCNIPFSSHTDIVEWHFGKRATQTRVRSRRWNAFPNRLVNQLDNANSANRAPRRWERVTVRNESQVFFNDKVYEAVFPIKQEGFGDFDVGETVNAGYEPNTRRFYVADQRPLDIDVLGPLIKQWLIDNGVLAAGNDGDTGGDIDGGRL